MTPDERARWIKLQGKIRRLERNRQALLNRARTVERALQNLVSRL